MLDVAGPLGRPTHIEPGARFCCIGGGIGTAVVYPIACGVKNLGGTVTSIIGGRTRNLVILEDELRRISDALSRHDRRRQLRPQGAGDRRAEGACSEPGQVFDEVVAVGPLPMMRAVVEVTRPLGVKTTVSLNPLMVDGTGMCGGCRVLVGGQQKFACVDGPEFDGHQVDFGELAARLRAYKEDEAEALRLYKEQCEADSAWAV